MGSGQGGAGIEREAEGESEREIERGTKSLRGSDRNRARIFFNRNTMFPLEGDRWMEVFSYRTRGLASRLRNGDEV